VPARASVRVPLVPGAFARSASGPAAFPVSSVGALPRPLGVNCQERLQHPDRFALDRLDLTDRVG